MRTCVDNVEQDITQIRHDSAKSSDVRCINQEKQYDCDALRKSARTKLPLLNRQQKYASNTLMKVVEDGTKEIFVLDDPGGN